MSENNDDELTEEQRLFHRKALRKLGIRLRKASEKYLSTVGKKDDVILKQIDFTVHDLQQLVAALAFEKAYFVELAFLFGQTQGEDTNPDMKAAQELGIQEGAKAAQEFFKNAKPVKPANEKPA